MDWAGAGATVPLTGFGNTLAKGVRRAVEEQGLLGALTGGVTATAGGITAAIFFGFLVALLCKSKPQTIEKHAQLHRPIASLRTQIKKADLACGQIRFYVFRFGSLLLHRCNPGRRASCRR